MVLKSSLFFQNEICKSPESKGSNRFCAWEWWFRGINCFLFLFIDFDKNFVTRMLRENFYRSVTPFISMAYSRSMIFTL